MLIDAGHMASLVETSTHALTRAAERSGDIVVLDLAVGIEARRFLRKRAQQRLAIPVLAIADRRQPGAATEALRLGVVDIVGRPVHCDDLLAALANALEFTRLPDAAQLEIDPPQPVDGIFAASPAMRDVFNIARRAAQSRCGVLIVGERGTGRETIARAIHDQGPQRDGSFMKLVCRDVEAAALLSAMNPAVRNPTLYLEDLAELPQELQALLEARMLEGRESVPRLIGSCQTHILERGERGLFRRGLLEAINVVRIDVPPLRQRTQEIPLLATHFLKEACRRHQIPAKAFSRGALSLLSALPWPGNIAELRALTERVAILASGGVVLLEDVLANVRFDGAEVIGAARGPLKVARERFERDYVTAVLQQHSGRMGAAARELGIERTNLYRKIKQLKIQWMLPA